MSLIFGSTKLLKFSFKLVNNSSSKLLINNLKISHIPIKLLSTNVNKRYSKGIF